MSRDESSVGLRTLIRGTAGTPGSGDDIANIVSSELPDGAQCFVISNRTNYRFRKHSTLAASGTVVIAPIAGGGRWVQEGPAAGALMAFAAATASNTTNSSESSNWLPVITSNFELQAGAGAWTINPAGCILGHTGPGGRYLVDLRATVSPTEGNAVNGIVSLNDDFTSNEAGFEEGEQFLNTGANFEGGAQAWIISCQRLVTLAPGDNIRPKFRYSVSTDLEIERLTLSAIAVS